MAANRSNYIISLIVATILLLALLERSMLFCQSLPEQNLCSGKDITLTTMADIRRTSADKCPIEVREAFDELAKLVVNQYDDDDDDAICSMNHAKRIGQYFRAHIHNHEQTANQRKRPPPLRILNRFAIAYGLEVARVCRETLVENLGRDLTCKQFAQLMQMKLPFLKLWSPVLDEMNRKPGNHPNLGCLTGIFALNMHLVNSITCKNDHPESAIVPAHFYGIFSRFESKHKLVLRLQNSVELFELQEICERHIRPTYEPLLSSQALLADLNLFNYNPSSSSDDNLERKESRWHGIVLLCESLKLVKFEEPIKGTAGARKWLDIVAATGGDSSKVRGERKNRNNQNTRLSNQTVKDDKFQKAALEAHDTSVSKSISSSGGVVDELRDRLFRHGGKLFDMNMLHLKWKSSMIMEKLIEMATRQVDDGQQDMKQLELVKSKLQTLLESNEERKLLKYISEMVADKNPQLSKFAASFQILLISTRVALVSIATSNVDPLGRSYKLFGIN